MYTKEFIIDQLKAMGAPQNSTVIVHSSLRAVGEVEGRAEGLLDALIEYFTADGGLLCIPTHTWNNMRKPRITLDMTLGESCIGTLPRIAAADSRGVRSANPTHSMMVFGDRERAEEFVCGEEEVLTPTSPDGCYGKIYKRDGYVLLIGVGHNKNTFIHCIEEMIGITNRIDPVGTPVSVKYKNGEIINRVVNSFNEKLNGDVSEFFGKYEPAFRRHGCVVDGFIGSAQTQLCPARKLKEVVELVRKRSGEIELLHDGNPLDPSWYN